MDHVVYLDTAASELEKLFNGQKTMLIRGAAGRKMPYGRVNNTDMLYFINNNGEGRVKARARVKSVLNSEALSEADSAQLIETHQGQLHLSDKQLKRWRGKRYLVLIEVQNFESIPAFEIDKSGYGNMDDWLAVGQIDSVKK